MCLEPQKMWPKEAIKNTRYKSFASMQLFTAGDEEQFDNARSYASAVLPVQSISLEKNIWAAYLIETNLWEKFKLDAQSTNNTFEYIFNFFKKGIFVKIVDNKVKTFLPFSKHAYKNNWGHLIKYDPAKYQNMNDFMSFVLKETGTANDKKYTFKQEKISKFTDKWYANNCLLRYEHPVFEGDTNVVILRHFFEELCATRSVPNIEFFINKRDFPIVTRNGNEPYFHIFGFDVPMHEPKQLCPVLSMCTSDYFADIAMPTHEDWARVASREYVVSTPSKIPSRVTFPPNCKDYSQYVFDTPWEQRIPTAVFRGGSTGCGVSSDVKEETFNQRLVAANLSYSTSPDKFDVPLIDAGITKWNLRPRKILNNPFLQTIDFNQQAPKVPPLTPEEQSKYKYLINIDGHVSAFRLSLEMSMGCCILLVESKIPTLQSGWKMWFHDFLKPYVHYVPVKFDLSDLVAKIEWCREHDEECKKIAENALTFSSVFLSKDGVLDYMQALLVKLHNKYGNGNVVYGKDPLTVQNKNQSNYLFKSISESLRPEFTTQYLIQKPRPIYPTNMAARGSFEWNSAYSLFLKNMFRPKNETEWEPLSKSQLNLKGVFEKHIFKNKKGALDLYYVGGVFVVSKTSSEKQGMVEYTNEAFISEKCINKVLSVIPNFAWSFVYKQSLSDDGIPQCVLLNEYIEGETLLEAIQNLFVFEYNTEPKCLKILLEILIQIMLSLQIAQEHHGFIHNDLTPWNIIVQVLRQPITIEYPLFENTFKIITRHVPVIIDYGKSHVTADVNNEGYNIHYGVVNMFEMNPGQDVFSIVIHSCFEMLKNSKYEERTVLTLLNFSIPVSKLKTTQLTLFKNIKSTKTC